MGKSITDLSSVTTVGLDLAKHVFQVHGVDASGRVVVAKAIRRNKLLEFFASLPPFYVSVGQRLKESAGNARTHVTNPPLSHGRKDGASDRYRNDGPSVGEGTS